MIDKQYGKYVGYCDICDEATEEFDNWKDCKDWIKENWSTRFDTKHQEWVHLCPHCKDLK
ncbi:MAG: hypothetical protein ACI4Q8_02635 [Ruminococcus sp.]